MDAVVCITDRNYLVPTKVLLSTLSDHLSPSVEIYVLSQDVTLADFQGHHFSERVSGVVDHSSLSIFAEVKRGGFKGNTHVTADAMAKLQLPFMFPDHRRVLYLDVDMICCSPEINSLFDIDLGGAMVAAVPDYKRARDPFRQVLGVPESQFYFNSGLVLFDLPSARSALTERIVADRAGLLADKVRFVDQDTLNHLFRGRVHYLDLKFNVFANVHMGSGVTLPLEQVIPKAGPSFMAFSEQRLLDAMDSRVVLHYTSSSKPWRAPCGQDQHWWAECDRLNLGLRRADRPAIQSQLQLRAQRPWARLKKAASDPAYYAKKALLGGALEPIRKKLDEVSKSHAALSHEIRGAIPKRVRFPALIDLRWANPTALAEELDRIFDFWSFEIPPSILVAEVHSDHLNQLSEAWAAKFYVSYSDIASGFYFETPLFSPRRGELNTDYVAVLGGAREVCSDFGRWVLIIAGEAPELICERSDVGPELIERFSDIRYDGVIAALYRESVSSSTA